MGSGTCGRIPVFPLGFGTPTEKILGSSPPSYTSRRWSEVRGKDMKHDLHFFVWSINCRITRMGLGGNICELWRSMWEIWRNMKNLSTSTLRFIKPSSFFLFSFIFQVSSAFFFPSCFPRILCLFNWFTSLGPSLPKIFWIPFPQSLKFLEVPAAGSLPPRPNFPSFLRPLSEISLAFVNYVQIFKS